MRPLMGGERVEADPIKIRAPSTQSVPRGRVKDEGINHLEPLQTSRPLLVLATRTFSGALMTNI